METDDAATIFDPLRPRLLRIAYRMLGSVADAEDVVQDAYLRWHGVDRAAVREPEGYLSRTVTRLCLDGLKSARKRREVYVGPWLPEPLVEDWRQQEPGDDDITLPLMMALDRLSPLERAAFLLHDVFGAAFDEVADAIGRDPAACRQLATRARIHVRAAKPRFPTPRDRGQEIAGAFFTASRTGDMAGLRALLAADVALHADGGGIRSAALRTVTGVEDVVRVHAAIARRFAEEGPSQVLRYGLINGLPGFVTRELDGLLQTTALVVEDDRVSAIYIVRNPNKLSHLDAFAAG